MSSEDVGRRSADGWYEWDVGIVDGKLLMIRHSAPDAVSHLYPAGDVNEPILLYRGRFTVLASDGIPERSCEGDIRLCWLPTPQIEVRGEYDAKPGDIEALLSGGADAKIWFPKPQIRLPISAVIPSPPTEEAPPWSRERHTGYFGPAEIYPPEIGDCTALTKVTGLIANGWDGHGSRIADPADPRQNLVRPGHRSRRRLATEHRRPGTRSRSTEQAAGNGRLRHHPHAEPVASRRRDVHQRRCHAGASCRPLCPQPDPGTPG